REAAAGEPSNITTPGAGRVGTPRRGPSPARLRRVGGEERLVLVAAERHAELPEERERLVVLVRGGHEGDVHAVDLVDHVVVDLREDHLLLHAERVVAATVEGARAEPAEVADARDRGRDEAVAEPPHPGAAQRDRGADLLPLAEAEVGDRLLRL